jgi:hypothetical protein
MRIWDIDLGEVRQSDGFTCGPTSAMFHVCNPASGPIHEVTLDEMQRHDLPLGFPRAFVLVLPKKIVSS